MLFYPSVLVSLTTGVGVIGKILLVTTACRYSIPQV